MNTPIIHSVDIKHLFGCWVYFPPTLSNQWTSLACQFQRYIYCQYQIPLWQLSIYFSSYLKHFQWTTLACQHQIPLWQLGIFFLPLQSFPSWTLAPMCCWHRFPRGRSGWAAYWGLPHALATWNTYTERRKLIYFDFSSKNYIWPERSIYINRLSLIWPEKEMQMLILK